MCPRDWWRPHKAFRGPWSIPTFLILISVVVRDVRLIGNTAHPSLFLVGSRGLVDLALQLHSQFCSILRRCRSPPSSRLCWDGCCPWCRDPRPNVRKREGISRSQSIFPTVFVTATATTRDSAVPLARQINTQPTTPRTDSFGDLNQINLKRSACGPGRITVHQQNT